MPNSVLWIGLVVLWVFVLFPILADRHPRIRRTTDAALATRVLHRGGSKRRIRIRAAGGHDSDPDYRPRVLSKRPHPDDSEDRMTPSTDDPTNDLDDEKRTTDVELDTTATLAPGEADPAGDETDTETVVAEADPRPAGDEPATAPEPAVAATPAASPPARLDDIETPGADDDFVPSRRGRGGYDPEADAIARATRYTFRQRAVLGLIIGAILFAVFGFLVNPMFWWAFGLALTVLGGYLAYLRRQVHVEEDIRRRRSARLVRGRHQGEPEVTPEAATARRTMDRDTARALRRRSTLLDSDDEDPVFEYLDAFDPATARALRDKVGDMRRAAGE